MDGRPNRRNKTAFQNFSACARNWHIESKTKAGLANIGGV